jgi:hypothetical protein
MRFVAGKPESDLAACWDAPLHWLVCCDWMDLQIEAELLGGCSGKAAPCTTAKYREASWVGRSRKQLAHGFLRS